MCYYLEMEFLNELNKDQKEAVLATKGPVLVIAGAGAGKTKTLTSRILYLIKQGVKPSSILAITFTNKASKEMKERVDKLLEKESSLALDFPHQSKPFISTFHSLGVHIIRENHKKFDLNKNFNILDRDDSKKIVKEALEEEDLDPKQYAPAKVLNLISRNKGNFVDLKKFEEKVGNDFFPSLVLKVWRRYEKKLKEEKALDFDDLLIKTATLLKEDRSVREYYQKVWQYIHIDEYQDTNKVQYQIAKMLVGEEENIFAVADIDQCIYSWRGSDISNVLKFEKDFKGAQIIKLEQNYRSTSNILNASNEIIKKNKNRYEKNLYTENEEGEKLLICPSFDENSEGSFVASKIKELLSSKVEPQDIAVLYRTNFQSRVLEEAMLRENIPYQVLGTKFFQRKEVKDILSFLKASLNPDNKSEIKRIINVPPKGIGKVSILKIFAGKEAELKGKAKEKVEEFWKLLKDIKEFALSNKPSQTIEFILKQSGYKKMLEESNDEERIANIYELASLASKYDFNIPEDGLNKLLEDAALASDQDEMEEKTNSVKLMTIHASKGLEFDSVFITGLEEGLFPSQTVGDNSNKDEEEERRLFYVALTRAKKRVFLTYAGTRMIYGSRQYNEPSQFVLDLDDRFTQEEYLEESGGVQNKEKIIYLDF